MNFELDHVGIAVTDLESAIAEYKKNFGLEVLLRETIESQGVMLAFLNMPGAKIELLAALSKTSALAKFIERHGPGIHHLCYLVSDIRAEMSRLANLGHALIDKEPRQGAHGSLIAFLHPKTLGGVLTELCQHSSSK